MKLAWPESQKRESLRWGNMASVASSGGGSELTEAAGVVVEGASGCWASIGVAKAAIIKSRAMLALAARRIEVASSFAPVLEALFCDATARPILKMNCIFLMTRQGRAVFSSAFVVILGVLTLVAVGRGSPSG